MDAASTRNPDPVKQWVTFLRNHREAIAAMDFFTVPTLTFRVLYFLTVGIAFLLCSLLVLWGLRGKVPRS